MDQRIELFHDILEERRQETSNFMWVSRQLNTTVSYKQIPRPTPNDHKYKVLQSTNLQELVEKICKRENVNKEEVEKQIKLILDEIGYNKRLCVIRWLGLVLTKICKQVCKGIFVNETSIMKVKSLMGDTPVVFLPSHRSYADFILMSYICFTYDLEIPAIAAGMDFHAMWGMGSILRDTGAFFMRRSFNDDSLYWETFREYVNQILSKGDLPIEFFIEGTRSRTGKSLTPKIGLLSMILKPFFTSQVPDILFVPINISYDRVLEEKLFAFELLGVPKPKESTSGFFKSLSIIKENYGNIFVNFGEPISAKQYFNNLVDRSIHSMQPVYMQGLTSREKQVTSMLAHQIVRNQQKLCVVTVFNLIALNLTHNFYSLNNKLFKMNDVIKDVVWLKSIFKTFGATINLENPEEDIRLSLKVHNNLVKLNEDLSIELVKNEICANNIDVRKLKGHALSQESMTFVVPFITLQIYINPLLHYLISPAIVAIILKRRDVMSKDILFGHYGFLRSLFSYELVTNEIQHNLDFDEALSHLDKLNGIFVSNNHYYLGDNKNLHQLLYNVTQPFIFTYYVVCKVILNMVKPVREKVIIASAQSHLEVIVLRSQKFVHPYCLNLDTLTNCLLKLTSMSAVIKSRVDGNNIYEGNFDVLCSIIRELEFYVGQDLISRLTINMDSKL